MAYRRKADRERAARPRTEEKRRPPILFAAFILVTVLAVAALSEYKAANDALYGTGEEQGETTSHTEPDNSGAQPGEDDGRDASVAPVDRDIAEVVVPDVSIPEQAGGAGEQGWLTPPRNVSMEQRDGVTYLTIEGHEMVLVNKQYPLPEDYGDGLTDEMREALDAMFAAAADDGIYIWVVSGFRSYYTQASIFRNYAASDGEEAANRYSARPGQSEHQTGLAVDLDGSHGGGLSSAFANTPEYEWLCENAADYGFILRFLPDREWATGYIFEPWHFRYVGVELAHILADSGLSVEEYAGLAEKPPEEPEEILPETDPAQPDDPEAAASAAAQPDDPESAAPPPEAAP